jgi:hypothetical protein
MLLLLTSDAERHVYSAAALWRVLSIRVLVRMRLCVSVKQLVMQQLWRVSCYNFGLQWYRCPVPVVVTSCKCNSKSVVFYWQHRSEVYLLVMGTSTLPWKPAFTHTSVPGKSCMCKRNRTWLKQLPRQSVIFWSAGFRSSRYHQYNGVLSGHWFFAWV